MSYWLAFKLGEVVGRKFNDRSAVPATLDAVRTAYDSWNGSSDTPVLAQLNGCTTRCFCGDRLLLKGHPSARDPDDQAQVMWELYCSKAGHRDYDGSAGSTRGARHIALFGVEMPNRTHPPRG